MNLMFKLIAIVLLASSGTYGYGSDYDYIQKMCTPQLNSNTTGYLNFDAFYFQNPFTKPSYSLPKCPVSKFLS